MSTVMGTFTGHDSYFTQTLTFRSGPILYPLPLGQGRQAISWSYKSFDNGLEMEKAILLIVLIPLEALAAVPTTSGGEFVEILKMSFHQLQLVDPVELLSSR